MVAQLPGLQQVREIRRVVQLVGDEILDERLQIAGEPVKVQQPVVVIERDDDIFRISRYVHHLWIENDSW